MAKPTDDLTRKTTVGSTFPKMLTLDQVQEILNVGKPMVYTLVKSGELRAAQFSGRGYLAQSHGAHVKFLRQFRS
ncbi:UNVERIFIED_ORG: excisionase family DNA binding protein [Arthrobacter sp. UYEF10]